MFYKWQVHRPPKLVTINQTRRDSAWRTCRCGLQYLACQCVRSWRFYLVTVKFGFWTPDFVSCGKYELRSINKAATAGAWQRYVHPIPMIVSHDICFQILCEIKRHLSTQNPQLEVRLLIWHISNLTCFEIASSFQESSPDIILSGWLGSKHQLTY